MVVKLALKTVNDLYEELDAMQDTMESGDAVVCESVHDSAKVRREDFVCLDCAKPTDDLWITHDQLWFKYVPENYERMEQKKYTFLCIECFEKRLGRRLTVDDLPECRANSAARLMARRLQETERERDEVRARVAQLEKLRDRVHSGSTVTATGCNAPECWCRPGVTVIPMLTPTPESVGVAIRTLLLSLRHPGHLETEEANGHCCQETNDLRARALDLAHICWNGSGKMHSIERRCAGRPAKLDDFMWQPPEDGPQHAPDEARTRIAQLEREAVDLRAKDDEVIAENSGLREEVLPLRARVAQLEEALRRVAVGKHYQEDYPDHPIHWSAKLTCTRCDAYGEDIDHLDRRHAIDCPVRLARAALSTSPSDWLAEHDRKLVTRAVYAASRWWPSHIGSKYQQPIVEEVLKS